ncbi:MAG: hypothetical protein BMS9Abin34_396 [Patescibacteria group bacterium]|nr:MAG: hypothetical protein BMS9Abin34_396 [Patescibacteria group bacterium]
MEKILLIDKPKGMTSHDVVNRIRRDYPREKVGHTGTLDPLATGLLIILIGKATKRQAEFLGLDKEYEIEITFGRETNTFDADGKVISEVPRENLRDLTKRRVAEALKSFRGEMKQTVPPYSAVKIKGKKLYELARKGEIGKIELPQRKVRIKKIELLDFEPFSPTSLPKVHLRVSCSKGTYMRSLAHDLGEKLGLGGYISKLKRTRIGPYKLERRTGLEPATFSLEGRRSTN